MTFALLALTLFWLSTRQWPMLVRLVIWATGLGLLCFAVFGPSSTETFSLRQALQDVWHHRENFESSAVAQALRGNAGTVARFVPQLSDFFIAASAVVAALALLAFTRGEHLERILRPTILSLVGFIAGSAATLAVVAIGFGGQVKPQTHLGYVTTEDVHDGDTFALGDVSLRLFGVEAPELSQVCGGQEECGIQARAHLAELLKGALVQCDQELSIRSQRATESFGRPLVTCFARRGDDTINVGEQMIRDGYAVRYEGNLRYFPNIQEHFALGCTLRPDVWRRNRDLRLAFENGDAVPSAQRIGDCSPS